MKTQFIIVLLTTGLFHADIHKIVTVKNGTARSGRSVGGVLCSAALQEDAQVISSFMYHT